MRLRRPPTDGNPPAEIPVPPGPAARRALLSVREALILSGGFLIGLAAGVLTYLGLHNLALAVLAAGPAFAGAIKFLDAVIA